MALKQAALCEKRSADASAVCDTESLGELDEARVSTVDGAVTGSRRNRRGGAY